MLPPQSLYDIAPSDLPNERQNRFDGSGFSADLNSFAPADRDRLAQVYATVDRVGRTPLDAGADVLAGGLRGIDTAALIRDASALGSDTPVQVTGDPRVRRLLHDIRGGGLQVLVGGAELIRYDPNATAFARNAVLAARDHAKIMRAGFPALDPENYACDELTKAHAVESLVATWDGLNVLQNGRTVRVTVDCSYHGAITGRCLETAAVERIMCNYVNNAVRFVADGHVSIWVFQVGPGLVRWAVHNTVSEYDLTWLTQKTGGDLRQLFRGGTTHGGNGIGLSACAEIVGECFGLDAERALRSGYLGAHADPGGYTAWFHWPVYSGSGDLCVCHD
ncbi:MAG TPA: ATP-binding protein [Gemmata sp.]